MESELERLRAESATLKERWNTEKTAITRVQQLKEEPKHKVHTFEPVLDDNGRQVGVREVIRTV